MKKHGISLLEVLISMVLLGGCVAILGEVARLGLRNAQSARELTQAQLLAESIMSQLQMGLRTLENTTEQPITAEEFIDTNAADQESGSSEAYWLYTIETAYLDDNALVAVAVTVTKNEPNEENPLSVRLVRWIIDPEIELEEAEAAAELEANANGTTTTTSSSSTE